MVGIGKTTLAKALFNKLIVHFKKGSFISSVREESQKPNGLGSLQGKLLASLNSSSQENIIDDSRRGVLYIKQITHNEPVLLVLDDVDNKNQLDVLAGARDWFQDGTRIIITSRDKNVFPDNIVDEIYEVEELSATESVQLFSYHALGREQPTKEFAEITEEIVYLTGRLPLALEVFGSFLFYRRNKREWLDAYERLQQTRPSDLQGILEISFNSLDEQERRIFLDLACFFVNLKMKREDAIDIFNGCGFNAETVVTDLTSKSLVKIVDKNVFWMHNQLQDMGREIVRRESYADIGQRSRLWDQQEILKVLNSESYLTLSENSHSIKPQFWLQFYNRFIGRGMGKDDETLHTRAFKPLVNLRLLQIDNAKLDGNFKLMPAELKWLRWRGCPLETLPSEFRPRDLAVLDLSESKISQLWEQRWWDFYGEKMGKKLLVVNLYACRHLQEIPYLSGLGLEKIDTYLLLCLGQDP